MLPGEQVGPVPAPIENYGVSRNTVLRAIKILRDAGLVTAQQGWGVFVAERP
jgi:DNA-binding GntR family transcriptional regulator